MNYLPSKKFITSVCILLVGGLFFLLIKQLGAPKNENQKIVGSGSTVIDESTIDSDNDGLKDWEEALLGTDPRNADSNANGTPDGKELENLKTYQNEHKDALVAIENSSLTKTLLESLGGFVNIYNASGKTENIFSNTATTQALFDQLSPESQAIEKSKKVYTEDDVAIDTSKDARTYFNEVGGVLKNNFSVTAGQDTDTSEIVVIARIATLLKNNKNSAETFDPELQKLPRFQKKYNAATVELLALSVPKDLLSLHLRLLNLFSSSADDLVAIEQMNRDPLLGYLGIQRYYETFKTGQTVSDDMQKIITSKKIVFSENEPGSILIFKKVQL